MPSARRCRRVLFALAFLVLPVPYRVVEGGWVPPIWLAAVAGLTGYSAATDGGEVSVRLSRGFAIEAALAALGAYVVAAALAWGLARGLAPARRRLVLWLVVVAAVVAAALPIYTTTAVRGGTHVRLPALFRVG
jgi:hypothetical protein